MSYEVEQKFWVDHVPGLQQRLVELGARTGRIEQHSDTYYNHPCRDFAQTQEALRIRRIDNTPHITYKGTKLPGAVKARRELEWPLHPGDPDGRRTEELWQFLGFRSVATVSKTRQIYEFSGKWSEFTVVIDDVDRLGTFAEIELVVEGEAEIDAARDRILQLASTLGLTRDEPRSYLRMFLALDRAE
jgi:adenylate cyclase class 2